MAGENSSRPSTDSPAHPQMRQHHWWIVRTPSTAFSTRYATRWGWLRDPVHLRRPNFPPFIHKTASLSTDLSTGANGDQCHPERSTVSINSPKLSTLAATFPHEWAIYPRKRPAPGVNDRYFWLDAASYMWIYQTYGVIRLCDGVSRWGRFSPHTYQHQLSMQCYVNNLTGMRCALAKDVSEWERRLA